MFHWIYVSTATEELVDKELKSLLASARKRNEELELSGLLLYANRRFIQVLEGSEANVMKVWHSINKDHRHKNIYTLRLEKKAARDFPDWRMGFRLLDSSVEQLKAFSQFLDPKFDISHFNNENEAYKMLLSFRDAHDN